jgi:nicotinamidase/pyrazinamidase
MKTVFFDVDTQLDFLFPAGALYVPGAEQIAAALGALTKLAKERGILIVSTMDTHDENDPEFEHWKPHCVRGTQGWQKYSSTTLAGQTIFEKNRIEFFEDQKLARLLDGLDAERFVVYGLVTEYCIKSAVFGLLRRGARVELVSDAIRSLDERKGREVVEKFRAAGGLVVHTRDILGA